MTPTCNPPDASPARRLAVAGLALAAGLAMAHTAAAQAAAGQTGASKTGASKTGASKMGAASQTVNLPGLRYQVLASGPAAGAHPTRADSVAMRYVGRLDTGEIFSTSPGDGAQTSTFGVKEVIPGMSAALQLMRPGDRWRITMPPYLAYGPGRPLATAQPANVQAVQKRGIPPDATLVFDVDLVAILAAKAP